MDNILTSKWFKSITEGLTVHISLFDDTHLVAKDPLKLNNIIWHII